jgi:formate-dependent nitrite reductase cytochrome c552 subunit
MKNEVITIKEGEETYFGYKKAPVWLKKKYRLAVNFTCQDCHKTESEVGTLEPHRIKRGVEGGLYTILPLNHPRSNIRVLCHKCHEKYNYSRKLNYTMVGKIR